MFKKYQWDLIVVVIISSAPAVWLGIHFMMKFARWVWAG